MVHDDEKQVYYSDSRVADNEQNCKCEVLGKLLVLSVLAFVVVSPAEGMRVNETTHFNATTVGKSGVVCTRQGRKCVFNATCHDHQCRCPKGQWGQAEIECANKDESLCIISGDPHIYAFGKAKSTISMPCRFRATRFATNNKNGHGSCSFEVHATNQLMRGRYVIRSVHIAVGITDHNLQVHTDAHVYKESVEYEVNDTEIYNYQARVIHSDRIWGSSQGEVKGVDINPTFDDVNNFAVLNVEACGVRIKFRAFDRRRPKHQMQVPGVSIQAPSHAVWYEMGEHPQSLCGTPDDKRSLYNDRADDLGLVDDNAGLLYDLLAMKDSQADNEQGDKCYRSFDLFHSSTSKVHDVNSCGFLVTKPKVARCIQDVYKQFPIDVFNGCMERRQDPTKDCTLYREAAALCDHLPDWSGDKSVDIHC